MQNGHPTFRPMAPEGQHHIPAWTLLQSCSCSMNTTHDSPTTLTRWAHRNIFDISSHIRYHIALFRYHIALFRLYFAWLIALVTTRFLFFALETFTSLSQRLADPFKHIGLPEKYDTILDIYGDIYNLLKYFRMQICSHFMPILLVLMEFIFRFASFH